LDPKNKRRFDELNFYQQELIDYLFGENMYENTDESIMKVYNQWAHLTFCDSCSTIRISDPQTTVSKTPQGIAGQARNDGA